MDRQYLIDAYNAEVDSSINNSQDYFEFSSDEFKPIQLKKLVHPEEEPSIQYINSITKGFDTTISSLNEALKISVYEYMELLQIITTKCEEIELNVSEQSEKVQDINYLLGNFGEHTKIETLTDEDFSGSFSYDSGMFSGETDDDEKISITITNVSGNGFEGNKYVLDDGEFASEKNETSDRYYMTDNDSGTKYEYTRVNAVKDDQERPSDFYYDDIEAQCVIEFESEDVFDTLLIESDDRRLIINSIDLSNDGEIYESFMTGPLQFQKEEGKYEDERCLYGTGLFQVPMSKYAKINFISNGYTSDVLGYSEDMINEG